MNHICNIISKTTKLLRESRESYISQIIESIPEGRPSDSFTGQLDENGKVKEKNREKGFQLFARTVELMRYMKKLGKNVKIEPIIVYRSINMEEVGDIVSQPVPFSTTWEMDFAFEWTTGTCCVFEIVVDFSTFLPLSIPKNTTCHSRQLLINQQQYEVVLPPCKLVKTGEYRLRRKGRTIRVIKCLAIRLNIPEIISAYPQKTINGIYKNLKEDADGFINEQLTNFYGGGIF
jgi:hypothetical protein